MERIHGRKGKPIGPDSGPERGNMKYRKKPHAFEATQWFKNGDHPKDDVVYMGDDDKKEFPSEGSIVRRYRHPHVEGETKCSLCRSFMHDHGWIDAGFGGHFVCPGDWVISSEKDTYYPCKPDIFEATYEGVQ